MTKLLYSILILLFAVDVSASADETNNDHYLDSLIDVTRRMPDDTAKLSLLNVIAQKHYSVDSTAKYAQEELDLATHLEDEEMKMHSLGYLAWAYYYMSEGVKCCECSYKAISIADSLGRRSLLPLYYQYLALGYDILNDGSRAIDSFKKALAEAEEQRDTANTIEILFQLSQVDIEANMTNDAEECMRMMEKLSETFEVGMGEYSNVKSRIYLQRFKKTKDVNEYKKAKEYCQTALKAFHEENNIGGCSRAAFVYCDIILYYIHEMKIDAREREVLLDSCMKMIDYGMACADDIDSKRQVDELKIQKTYILKEEGKYKEAEELIKGLAGEVDLDNDDDSIVELICEAAVSLYKSMKDYKELAFYQEKLLKYEDRHNNVDYISQAASIGARQEYEMKIKERDIASERMRTQSEWRRKVIAACVVALIMMVVTIGMEIRTNVRRKRLNKQLDEQNQVLQEQQDRIMLQNESLEQQKSIIEAQNIHLESKNDLIARANKEMIDGMNYASLLQRAAMPSETLMNSVWGSNMVVYKPLKIVSGDFYWASNIDGYRILVVADCTGHGVPGAFLSMLGISILNEVTQKVIKYEASAGKMLDEVNRIFKRSLNQNGYDGENKDGIDMSMVIISPDRKKMHYAGAFRPLLVVSDKKAKKYDADRMSIGTSFRNGLFKDNEIDLNGGELIYMFTDGVTDQFGYDSKKEVKKYTIKQLINTLEDISHMPLTTQQAKIELTFDAWRTGNRGGVCEQTDDILLVGVRV